MKNKRKKFLKKKNKALKKRRIRKRKMNQTNSLMKIPNDNISQIISFLKPKEIMNIRNVNKNLKFVVDKYKLEKVAIKYFFDSSYPRLYESWCFTYGKQCSLKDMKAFLYKYKNDKNNFHINNFYKVKGVYSVRSHISHNNLIHPVYLI